jgi:hypothetical protein
MVIQLGEETLSVYVTRRFGKRNLYRLNSIWSTSLQLISLRSISIPSLHLRLDAPIGILPRNCPTSILCAFFNSVHILTHFYSEDGCDTFCETLAATYKMTRRHDPSTKIDFSPMRRDNLKSRDFIRFSKFKLRYGGDRVLQHMKQRCAFTLPSIAAGPILKITHLV